MKFRFPLFLIVLAALLTGEFLALNFGHRAPHAGVGGSEASRIMEREAKLIDYFCFSRIPPIMGAALVPNEWEQALGSELTLTDNPGELAGKHHIIVSQLEAIRGLQPGSCVTFRDPEPPRLWHAVYRPLSGGTRLLHLAKPQESLSSETAQGQKRNWPMLVLIAVIGAALVTVIDGLMSSRRSA